MPDIYSPSLRTPSLVTEAEDEVPQLPPFYSPRPTPISHAISELDLDLDLNLSSISTGPNSHHYHYEPSSEIDHKEFQPSTPPAHELTESESLPGLLSPAFTPPSTPGFSTPLFDRPPQSVPVDSSDPAGGCGSKRPKLLSKLPTVHCVVRARIPTTTGTEMFLHLYQNSEDNKEHLAIVFGENIRSNSLDAKREGETEMDRLIRGAYTGRLFPGRTRSALPATEQNEATNRDKIEAPLVRIHSECYTGETVWSARCDCGEQLDEAARIMSLPSSNGGIIVYLRQEGRGIGLGEKLKAYNLQDLGSDTVEANLLLRHPADARSYGLATAILVDLGVEEVRLLTNNPEKVRAVEGPNREVVVKERVAMIPLAWRVMANIAAQLMDNRLRRWAICCRWGMLHDGRRIQITYQLFDDYNEIMSVGWIVVSIFTFFVALGMAEIVSAIPTAGGPYYWAAMLAPEKRSAFASWMTGWFNLLGQVAVTTGISFGLAGLISTTATIKSSYVPSAPRTIGIYAAVLVSHATINTFGVHVLRYLNNTSIALHSLGITSLAIAVLAKAPTHQSAKFVFATFYDGTGDPGWGARASPAYVACCGALMSQYTLTGFDASAHLSEETRKASWSAPIGVITSDFDGTVDSAKYAQPVIQILVDVFGDDGAVVLMMMFAFARDGGIPHFFHKVDGRFRSPIRTVWLASFLSFCLALPSLGSSVAFAAATSIATIGLYISYGIPIFIGLLYPSTFTPRKGPFNLGVLSRPVAFVAVAWIMFITIIFCLPTTNPVTSQTLNYTVVAVGIIAIGALGSWIVWARKWFVGPVRDVKEAERLGVCVLEPGELELAEERDVKNVVKE
ncbi:hypothetical protein B7494_g5643 [Chlorociboria aeruginascens]|nr:hypothetical protein B7494_g5643 [Chlorociboria aeruginascens]